MSFCPVTWRMIEKQELILKRKQICVVLV